MQQRALVLGGGGIVGVAWELGVAAGLIEAGVDLAAADLFIGTSAGSIVGSILAAGVDVQQLLMFQMAAGGNVAPALEAMDPESRSLVTARWSTAGEMTREVRQELGALALSARTVDEATWVGSFTQILGEQGSWPERPLLVTAVDAGSGEFKVWDRASGVPLHVAVASSCTVPGLFPPVSIQGHRYIDGGVRSSTNADLAEGYGAVLVIAPLATEGHPLGHRQLMQEMAHLRAGGSAVAVIWPDPEAIQAFGGEIMNATQVVPTALAGMRQGKQAAERLAAVWSTAEAPR